MGAIFLAGLLVGMLAMFEVVPATSLRAGGDGSSAFDDSGEPLTADGEIAAADGTVADGGTGIAGAGPGATGGGTAGTGGGTTAGKPGAGPAAGPGAVASSNLRCDRAGNGGATDRGVTADKIRLATTVVNSGPGASFQAEMKDAMEAVARAVNRTGGICGRLLSIEYKDDGWDPQRGGQFTRNFIDQGVFAIPVGASSEAINNLAETGDFDKSKTPVVGSDGLEIGQYQRKDGAAQQWIWPVATATVSSARIMVNEAYQRGARDFGVVFDKTYKFGAEAAQAFKAEVARLPGTKAIGSACDARYCPLQNGLNSYSTEAATFYGTTPDFVALFLEPGTALTWMKDNNTKAPKDVKFGYGAAQPLFTDKFGSDCGGKCDGMQVWTGFKPYLEAYEGDPKVREYVTAMKSVKPNIDFYNQFSQGAYVGMQLFVQALREVGPGLTRAKLQEVLNRTTLATGLTIQEKLTFSPDTRFANTTMQGFVMQNKGTWGRWRAGPIVVDPRPSAGTS
jgi:ABC-type branched-subunit amino acid transport system substrate-binding protein